MNIFLEPERFSEGVATIVEGEHLHLTRVMRAKVGQKLILLDGLGCGYEATISEIGKHQTTATILSSVSLPPEPPIELTVAQALGKSDKLESVIQHGTEIGAKSFAPIRSERCVVDTPAAKIPGKMQRWRQIAKSAAEQSHRAFIPSVFEPASFKSALEAGVNSESRCFLLHTAEDSLNLADALKAANHPRKITLFVGPEGGWSPGEIAFAEGLGVRHISLGRHVLRTETAALVAISQILFCG